jgi:hypothetical protein
MENSLLYFFGELPLRLIVTTYFGFVDEQSLPDSFFHFVESKR